jgi:glycosyltransferase involved in cell wall biosynthesis
VSEPTAVSAPQPVAATALTTPPPRLSVTVTNYNYGRYLAQTIESILTQSFDDFELILIDNASTDESLAVMQRYAEMDPRIRIVAHHENQGMFASLRQSCALARGRYRVHVNADDWILSPEAFRTQVDLLDSHPTMSLVYSSLTMVDRDGQTLNVSHPHDRDLVMPSEEALEGLLSFQLADSGLMFRLDCFRATAGYPDDRPHVADQLLAVRLSEQAELVGYLDRPLYAFRQHGSNLNLRAESDVVKREFLPALDEAFRGPVGVRLPRSVKRRMRRTMLVHLPTQFIFNDRRRAGWCLYWESVKVRPIDTVFQPRTLALAARTVLGARGYDRLRSCIGRTARRT